MARISRLSGRLFTVTALCLILMAPSAYAKGTPFYKGKTIRIVVGFSAGGGFDTYARLVARHIGGHIPGNPHVIVSNMPGAGSVTAVRSLESQPKDGTAIVAFNPAMILDSITEPKKVPINFRKLKYLGSVSANVGVCYTWHTTGIKNWEDLKARKTTTTFGASGAGSSPYIEAELLKNLFNLPVKVIVAYPGSKQVNLAVERGELDANCGTWQSLPVAWITGKKINVIYTYSRAKPKGVNAPYLLDLAKNRTQRQMLKMVVTYNDVFRPLAVSPAVPQARVHTLRTALWATVHDKAFLREAKKARRPIIGPATGSEMQKMVADMYDISPALVKKVAKAIQ